MTDSEAPADRVVASRLLDRNRVADAIQRGVHLEIHPAHAKAAALGMPVELTNEQALTVADVALEALAKTHPGAKSWLIEANKELRECNERDRIHWKIQIARQRRTTDTWRAASMGGWVWMVAVAGKWLWLWPDWAFWVFMTGGLSAGAVLRTWLLRRDQRKAAGR